MAELKEVDAEQLHQEDANIKDTGADTSEMLAESVERDQAPTQAAATNPVKTEAKNGQTSSAVVSERHVSIQTTLEGLETLVDLNGAGRKSCPLCPEEKFKACYSHKLRRHLQNLHWKVYVEFEGQRMCICHLPCRQLKSSLGSDQTQSRLVAHYHCVVCSVTIARKTDMISHLKRHFNKGETEASYSGSSDVPFEEPVPCGQAYEIMKELGTNVQLLPNHTTPQKTDTYFSRKMKTNRQLVFCSLAVLAEERNPLECLDAFGATGIMGLQWAKHLRNSVKVTINDISEACVKMIKENCHLNHIRVEGARTGRQLDGAGDADSPVASVEVVKMDANVIMHLRPFDYMAAARCNKGIEVLLAVALEHFVLVVVRVLRGPTQADESAKKLRQLLHCQWCEERVFLKPGSMVEENLYRQLPCQCHGSMPGKTAVEIGPLWAGPLFNTGFLRRMLVATVQHNMEDIQPVVKTLICEADCTTLKPFPVPGFSALSNQVECGVVIKTLQKVEEADTSDQSGKRKTTGEDCGNVLKKVKSDTSLEHPAFYYSIHRHSIRGMNMPKLNKFLQYLTEAGFRVSRTHFDPTGVRTDATLAQFKEVLTKYSVPTYSSTPQSSAVSSDRRQTL
ncbi:TRMT1-like protein isoform X2 [Chanodichthys erythropterus]|uniref:TRMT1-like protein isoform X2 n=1 Tax=Chanodichthys erythropterus TaxID=933992 RepID=UPI00351E2E89